MGLQARLALIATAAALFIGCSGSQNLSPGAATPQRVSQSDLVYATLSAENVVYIYSYPDGKRVGTLSGLKNPVAGCSDSGGDVWVVDSKSPRLSMLLEYAHGGLAPIASLRLDERADACSVDPSTGNLAAATLDSNVAVWQKAQGTPVLISTSAFFKRGQTIAYDGAGNLYVRSFASGESAAWLPKGSSAVAQFSIKKLGAYGWDGRYFVIGSPDGGTGPLTRYKLDNGNGNAVGKVSVKLCSPSYVPPSFAIAGSRLVISCGLLEGNSLNYYAYPRGGNPTKHLVPGQNGSVAISTS